jgi:UTP-glucose-1-phosphate uridylyltransferase
MGGHTSVVALEKVPDEKVRCYGISGGTHVDSRVLRIGRSFEKPSLVGGPGRTAVTGAYYLTSRIFRAIRATPLTPRSRFS